MSSTKTKKPSKASGSKSKPTKGTKKSTKQKSPSKKPAKAKGKAGAKKTKGKKAKWSDKPKNVLIAFWESSEYVAKLDKALIKLGFVKEGGKNDGKANRSDYLHEMCDAAIQKANPKKKVAKKAGKK